MLQVNKFPGEKHGAWDYYWGDARGLQVIDSLKHALSFGELPHVDLFSNLGWNLAGDIFSFWNPLNFASVFLSSEHTMWFRTYFLLFWACLGTFCWVRKITESENLAWVAAFSYCALPILITFYYFDNLSMYAHTLPFLLFTAHQILERPTRKRVLAFAFVSGFSAGVAQFNSFSALLPALTVYTLLVSRFYFSHSWKRAVSFACALPAVMLVMGAYYFVPLFTNFWEISGTVRQLQSFGLSNENTDKTALYQLFVQIVSRDRLFFFFPGEGRGLIPYAPAFWWISALAIAFSRAKSKNLALVLILVLIAAGTYFLPLVAYHPLTLHFFKSVAENSRGVMRYQINLIPCLAVMAGAVAISIVSTLPRRRYVIFVSSILALAVWSECHGVSGFYYCKLGQRCDYDWPLPSTNGFLRHPFASFYAMWSINFLLCGLALATARIAKWRNEFPAVPMAAGVLALLWIGVIVEVGSPIHSKPHLRSAHLKNSYRERKACLDGFVKRADLDFRTLYLVAEPNATYNDYKVLFEGEMNVRERQPALFQYRELDLPYVGVPFGMLGRGFQRSNFGSIDALGLDGKKIAFSRILGLKSLVVANTKIAVDGLEFRGSCTTRADAQGLFDKQDPSPYPGAAGTVHAYEVTDPLPRFFSVSERKVVSGKEVVDRLMKRGELPWNHDEVWTETTAAASEVAVTRVRSRPIPASVVGATSQSLRIEANRQTPGWLVLSLAPRKWLRTTVNGVEVPVARAYGFLTTVPVPAGRSVVSFEVRGIPRLAGLLVSLLGLLGSLVWGGAPQKFRARRV